MSKLTIIVAATKTNGIGQNARLPWRLPAEMAYFARVTSHAPEGRQNSVIMGRNTWESIPTKFRPLKNRINVVISRNKDYDLGTTSPAVTLKNDLSSVLDHLPELKNEDKTVNRHFVIGGASLYRETLTLATSAPAFVDRVLLTRILSPSFDECDVFMPDFLAEDKWTRASHAELESWVGFEVAAGVQEENGVKYEFQMWTR